MKTVFRQDGSSVTLSDADAARWLKQSLAFLTNPKEPAQPAGKQTLRSKVTGAFKTDPLSTGE